MILTRVKRFFIGEPLSTQAVMQQRLSNWKALSVLSSDALSSVAYATEEILIPLSVFAVGAYAWSMPIALAIAVLLVIIVASYRQTISAYPGGGGAYAVAKDNLGRVAGLIAGASLLVDYILTVAVSVAAGVAAITSAYPALYAHNVIIAVVIILGLTILNLRGMRGSLNLFALPTYLFIITTVALFIVGTWKIVSGEAVTVAPIVHEVYPAIPVLLILRAFSHGCTALTGIEAISSGVTAFRSPVQKNAKITLTWMALILAILFLGITSLAHVYGASPMEGETVLSALGKLIFGDSLNYYFFQIVTALVLFSAANTSYAGFPILASHLARDRYLPRQLASLGDKLVFSNGILGLGVAASALIILFQANTHWLIPLYAIGVFLSFSLSQAGMVLHHWRGKKLRWIRSLVINAVGALTTFVVLFVIASTKFLEGAWIVLLVISIMVLLFLKIYDHYIAVGRELSLAGVSPPGKLQGLKHTVIIPVSGVHRGVIDALRYAITISDDVRACYVELDPSATLAIRKEWDRWAHEIPFVVLKSPFRSITAPLLEYINDVEQITHNEFVTVIIPEFVTARWTHRLLHNQSAFLIRAALMFKRGKVVTSVRYHLRQT